MHYRSCAWLYFLIAAAVIAVDLSQRLDPQGPLGLGLEYAFSTSSSKRWQFNVHITFNKATDDITDRQLVQMALDGLAEMTKEQLQYGVKPMPRNTPAVITALRFGNEVILASSKKGNWEFMDAWPESKVSDALRRCQLAFLETNDIDSPHKNGASCGEVMAAHIFYQLYPDKDLKDMGAVAVSVMRYRLLEDGDLKAQVLDPCPLEAQTHWGCNKFTADQNWRVIPVKTQGEPYDLITLSGGVQSQEVVNILACSGSSST